MHFEFRWKEREKEEWESRELIWKESGGRGSGERESLVIYISIPSTACAVRQPVRPNKQPAEGGCLIITSPLSHPEFTFHLTTNTRPRLRLCPLSPLESQDVRGAGKATIHMLFSTRRGQYSTRRHPGRHNEDSLCVVLWEFKRCPLQPDASFNPLDVLLFRTPATFSTAYRWKTPVLPEGDSCTQLARKTIHALLKC